MRTWNRHVSNFHILLYIQGVPLWLICAIVGLKLSIFDYCGSMLELKVGRPHPHDNSTHRQTPRTDNDSSLLFAALGKAEPLISIATHQKFDPDQ